MAKKVSKNQRTDRGKNANNKKMAKILVAERKPNGQFAYKVKMVHLDNVQDELKAVQG
ncbi:MAG: hypothetical protein J0L94_13715 [Rhodothermia bacterium]|nr:hypothetical protein [Rhodothermia bacterium]